MSIVIQIEAPFMQRVYEFCFSLAYLVYLEWSLCFQPIVNIF